MKNTKERLGALTDLTVNMPMTRDCVSDIRAIIAEARQSIVWG